MKKFTCLMRTSPEDNYWLKQNMDDVLCEYRTTEVLWGIGGSKHQVVSEVVWSFVTNTKEQENLLVLKFGSLDNFMWMEY